MNRLSAIHVPRPARLFVPSLLALACVVPAVAQKFDASNWGKNTAGVTLAAHEGSRDHTDRGTVLWYNLIGKGFPDGTVYNLWRMLPGKSPEVLIKGVSFDQRGVLVCSGKPGFCSGQEPDDPVNLKTTAALGEEKHMAVISGDGKSAGFADAVPFPIEATDKGCKLSVVRMSAQADVMLARASGLKPNQGITVAKRYGYETGSGKYTAGPDGTWESVVSTQNAMQPSGKATISVEGGSCLVSVTFDYGPESNKPQ
ncbi:MAG: hypothetical protein P4M04_00500 [Acidobacteriota bacterium]|nr:hypothetical protein [Acidobacteriota bacterium]